MPVRQLIVIGTVLLAAGCGQPQPPGGTPATASSQAVQLGGPPTDAGTLNADSGEIKPADPAKFYKEPGYSPYAGRRYPSARTSATSTSTPRGRLMPAAAARRSVQRRPRGLRGARK